jgi:glycosyltransferase involved in cell wall biosynthesis
MKILFAIHQFFPDYYFGTERDVLNLSKQMQKMGHHVMVLTYLRTETAGLSEKCGVHVKEYTYQGVPIIAVRHKNIPEPGNILFFDETFRQIMDDILTNGQYDILHVCHSQRIGEVIRSAKKKGIPIILTLTDFWLMCPRSIACCPNGSLCEGSNSWTKCMNTCDPEKKWEGRIVERFEQTKEIFASASRIVSPTRFLKILFETQGHAQDIKVIPFGKDYKYVYGTEKNYTKNSTLTIGFISALLPHKGAHRLIEAFILANPQNIRLKIYGDYLVALGYFDLLQKISNGHPGIEFCGRYDYEEIPQIIEIDNIDIIAVPSVWWENSPLVLISAMAHNIPAIVSNLGGLTEIITDGQDGFTFTVEPSGSDDPKNLLAIIKKLSNDPGILNELKANIKLPSRIEEEAFEYESLYRTVVPVKTSDSIMTGNGDAT